jgi:hypothetical protein
MQLRTRAALPGTVVSVSEEGVMRPEDQVFVVLDGVPVPGLVLKWRIDRTEALVTYELEGKVETAWVVAARVLPQTEPQDVPLPD